MFVFVYDFLSEYVPQAHYLFTLQPQPHFLSTPVKNSQSTTVRQQKAGLSLLPPLISGPLLSLYSRALSISPLAIYNAPSSPSVSSDSTSFPLHLIAPSLLSYPSSPPLCRACLISMLVHTTKIFFQHDVHLSLPLSFSNIGFGLILLLFHSSLPSGVCLTASHLSSLYDACLVPVLAVCLTRVAP